MPYRKLRARYLGELVSAHVLFFTVYFLSAAAAPHLVPGLAQTLIVGSPALPAFLMLVAVTRFYLGADEYQRGQMLENWSLTAGVTFLWTLTYGLLEGVGLPHLNLVWICPAMGVVSGLVFFFRSLLIRHSEAV